MLGFCLHKYGKWSIPERGNIIDRNREIIGFFYRQSRVCTRCGKRQEREVS